MARKRRDLLAHRDVLTFAAAGLWVLQCLLFRHFRLDDAFIAYRYARHLAEGLGPVMNAGERVEGVSNLPWTALLGLLNVIGLEPHAVAPVLSLLCGFACIALVADLTARVLEDRRAGGFAALLFAASSPVAVWSVSGMETLAFTVLLTLVAMRAAQDLPGHRDGWRIGIGLGGAACLRPEGLAYTASYLANGRGQGRWLIKVGLGVLVVLAPLLLFRWLYYGDWLPNTVRAKAVFGSATFVTGVMYVVKAVSAYPLLFLSLLVLRHLPAARRWLLGSWVLTTVAVACVAGGERIPAYRLLLPAWPVLALCGEAWLRQLRLAERVSGRACAAVAAGTAGLGIWLLLAPGSIEQIGEALLQQSRVIGSASSHLPRLRSELRGVGAMAVAVALLALVFLRLHGALRAVELVGDGRRSGQASGPGRLVHEGAGARRAVGVIAALGLAVTLLPLVVDPSVRGSLQPDPAVRFGLPVGAWLRQNVSPGTLVATNCAGSLPYEAELPVLDMLGLTDAQIARSRADASQWTGHARGDGSYVLSRRPGIIIFGGPEGSAEPWPFPGDQEIARSPQFQRNYVMQRVPMEGFEFIYFARRTLANEGPRP